MTQASDRRIEAAARAAAEAYFEERWEETSEIDRALWRSAAKAALAAADAASWQPIEEANKDDWHFVWAAPREGLPGFVTICNWHPDAGWCVDELRPVTMYCQYPAPPPQDSEDQPSPRLRPTGSAA